MKKRIFLCFLALWLVLPRVNAEGEVLRWVEFDLSYSALKAALEQDIHHALFFLAPDDL